MPTAAAEALTAVLAASAAQQFGGLQQAPAGLEAAVQEARLAHSVSDLTARLLQLGADPSHARAADGLTPLAAAIAGGHIEEAGLLLDAGADANSASAAAASPPGTATAATATPAAAAADVLANGSGAKRRRSEAGDQQEQQQQEQQQQQKPGSAGPTGGHPTPLVLAVAAGQAGLVERLLAAGADPNRQCNLALAGAAAPVPLTPLIAAVNAGSEALASRLLAAGADLHAKCFASPAGGVDWTSALSAAVLRCPEGSDGLVRLLVGAGACAPRGGGQQVGRDHPALRAAALAAQRGRADLLGLLYPPLAAALQGESEEERGGHPACLG